MRGIQSKSSFACVLVAAITTITILAVRVRADGEQLSTGVCVFLCQCVTVGVSSRLAEAAELSRAQSRAINGTASTQQRLIR